MQSRPSRWSPAIRVWTLSRNRGIPLARLTTINLDFIRSYRAQTNVVSRPTAGSGRGYSLVGHHELMIPLLAAAVVKFDQRLRGAAQHQFFGFGFGGRFHAFDDAARLFRGQFAGFVQFFAEPIGHVSLPPDKTDEGTVVDMAGDFDQVTQLVYRRDITGLRDRISRYLERKQAVWVLFDNLDKERA